MSAIHIPADLPLFHRQDDCLVPTRLAAGPWYPGTQHGSTMLLMVAMAAEQVPGGDNRQITRLTVDMMRAAPMGPVSLQAEARRQGGSLDVLDLALHAEGRECVRASALRFRLARIPVIDRLRFPGSSPALPAPLAESPFAHVAHREGFHQASEIRVDLQSDPSVLWLRLRQPVLPGQTATPLQRVALAADWTYSVPNIIHRIRTGEGLRSQSFFAINPDTTINLQRQPEGEWIGIQAYPGFDDYGAGTVAAPLFDQQGVIGFCTQSVLIRGEEAAPMHVKDIPTDQG
ncbi:MAG: thioesterase family protein [Pseudomonadota bacterium]|nr:thioesterase family protein [Pseudomonadota bacterium]